MTAARAGVAVTEERSAGAIAFLGSPPSLLMIHDSYGRWTFPKGLIEPGETPRQAALRELLEETGVGGSILADLGVVRYFYTRADKQVVRKQVFFFLVEAQSPEVRPQVSEIAAARWVPGPEAEQVLAYRNMQPVLVRALGILGTLGRGEFAPGADRPAAGRHGRADGKS
jgi:8-oxo-dGTP pyrophosphatase MutT (NUDIX family)